MSKGTRWQRWVLVALLFAVYAGFRLRSFPQPDVHLSRAVPVSRSPQHGQVLVTGHNPPLPPTIATQPCHLPPTTTATTTFAKGRGISR